MPRPFLELERAAAENFNEAGYLLANPDVAAWVRTGGDAHYHLIHHGVAEGRQQASAEHLLRARELRRDKYERFQNVLDRSAGSGGTFRFAEEDGAFPVAYGSSHHDLSDYDRESANESFSDFTKEIERNPDRLYLDVGCGFRNEIQDNCLYLEVYPSRTADIIMEPASLYPIATASLDGIGCFAVLEHVREPWAVAAEFRRMLKPGGLLFIDWPFLQPVHGFPSHYYNATQAGLQEMFATGFDTIALDTRDNQTPDRALMWILRGWIDGLTDEAVADEMLGKTVADLLAEPRRSPFWKRVLAATPPDVRTTYACGNTLIARKR